jgi:serine/threonine-protein kinase
MGPTPRQPKVSGCFGKTLKGKLMIGKMILHYKIFEELGAGGMGVVYKAEDTKLKRTVALKFLPFELTRDASAKKRFMQEARAASALDHPNICTIHQIDETPEGQMFICMACYEGNSLEEQIAQGSLDVGDVIDIAAGIAEGLAGAHKEGIAHRDIKPANILITRDDQVKIVDFGLAKLSGQTRITKTGTTVGTAAYMSPEQAKGESVDHRTDIWSLGVVIFEMVTGELPFRGEYEHAITYSIINEPLRSMTTLRTDVPDNLERIVEKALAKDPSERYQHVTDLVTDLRSLKSQLTRGAAQPAPDDAKTPSIAVLPFVNMSPDPDNAFFADGLSEELINALTHIEGVRVAARTSAFRYRGEDVDIREIGQKLSVGTVLEGSVRKAGNRLRVTAQLINIEDGYHLWSERYDREMLDIFAIQDEITTAIVDQLKGKLVGKAKARRVKRYTDNLDAYSLYLKAQHELFTLTAEGWRNSFELFQQAVQLDPSFALPYVALSQIYQSQCFWGDEAPDDAMPKSRAAVEKALALDDGLGPAHTVLAVIYWVYDWDFDNSEREFEKASAMEPGEPLTHINYALFLAVRGRFEEAVARSERGRKLDPLSSIVWSWGAIPLAVAGRYDEAIECLEHAVSLNPSDWQPYIHLSHTYLNVSRIDDAGIACERAVELSGRASIALATMAGIHYLSGRVEQGDELLEELTDRSRHKYVFPSLFEAIHSARGDREAAMKYLKESVRTRDSWLVLRDFSLAQFRLTGPDVDAILAPVPGE